MNTDCKKFFCQIILFSYLLCLFSHKYINKYFFLMATIWKWHQRESKKKPWCEVRRSFFIYNLFIKNFCLFPTSLFPPPKLEDLYLCCLLSCTEDTALQTWRSQDKWDFSVCGVVNILAFALWRTWNEKTVKTFCYRRAFFFFMTNTFEESFKNNPFCLERLLVMAAKAIETLGFINHACEGYQSRLWGLWETELMRNISCIWNL